MATPNLKNRPPVGIYTPSAREGKPPVLWARPIGEDARMSERRAMAMQLRKDGNTYRAIGKVMGVSTKTAYSYVQAEVLALREQTQEDAEAVRDLELTRLDDVLSGHMPLAVGGDPQSAIVVLKVMERRAKLLGLDQPERPKWDGALVTPEQAGKMSDDQVAERIKALLGAAVGLGQPQISAEAGDESPDVIDVPVTDVQ